MTTTPTVWAPVTIVSNTGTVERTDSAIAALREGGFVMAWQVAGQDLGGRRFTETGAPTGSDFVSAGLASFQGVETRALSQPSIVQMTNGDVALAYKFQFSASDGDIYNAVFRTANGLQLAVNRPLESTVTNAPDLFDAEAHPDYGYIPLYAFQATPGVLRLPGVGPDATVIATGTLPVGGFGFAADADLAVLNGGQIAVGWVRGSSASVQIFSSWLQPVGAQTDLGEPGFENDRVDVEALTSGGFVASWNDGSVVLHQLFDSLGRATGGPFTSFLLDVPSESKVAALHDGGFLIGTTTYNFGSPETFGLLRRFGANGEAIGTTIVIDEPGSQTIEAIQTLSDGRVVVSFSSPLNGLRVIKTIILDPREASLTFGDGDDAVMARLDDTTISAGAGRDRVTGLAGDDILNGQAGDDTLAGGIGDDTLDGGSGTDTLNGNDGDDVLKGGSGIDSLTGGSGSDTLYGGSSGDILIGGANRDTLWGGTGNDLFRYQFASDSGVTSATQDVIRDFVQAEDKIDLSLIDANLGVANNQGFTFIGGAAFSAAGQVRATTVGGFTRVEMNTTGTTGAESGILVEGIIAFTSSDFIL